MKINFKDFTIMGSAVELKQDMIDFIREYNKKFKMYNAYLEERDLVFFGEEKHYFLQLPKLSVDAFEGIRKYGRTSFIEFDSENGYYEYNISLPNHIYSESDMDDILNGLSLLQDCKEILHDFVDDIEDIIIHDYM